MKYKLYKGDCLKVMDELIEQEIKVDMILIDPPYEKTRGKWFIPKYTYSSFFFN